jgi:lipopolysaccharide biosynthesis regulator YciM
LSAAYLIVGKQNKSYEFVVKAVEYASNNTEARVLKGLMELEQGKFKEAHEELVWACGIETDNNILAKVRDLIKKIGDSVQR